MAAGRRRHLGVEQAGAVFALSQMEWLPGDELPKGNCAEKPLANSGCRGKLHLFNGRDTSLKPIGKESPNTFLKIQMKERVVLIGAYITEYLLSDISSISIYLETLA